MKSKAVSLTLSLVMVAGAAFASNTGFKLNYNLRKITGKTSNNWFAVPFFYFPTGVVGVTGNSLDLCQDLNEGDRLNLGGPPKVVQVVKFDTLTDAPKPENCNSKLPVAAFVLIPGQGYSVKATTDNTVVNIVGSMDDNFAKPPKGGTSFFPLRKIPGKTSNNLISVPYHVKANNSLDLCNDLNNGDRLNLGGPPVVVQVVKFDTLTDAPKPENCNSKLPVAAFDLVPGAGYSAKPQVDNAQINYDVY